MPFYRELDSTNFQQNTPYSIPYNYCSPPVEKYLAAMEAYSGSATVDPLCRIHGNPPYAVHRQKTRVCWALKRSAMLRFVSARPSQLFTPVLFIALQSEWDGFKYILNELLSYTDNVRTDCLVHVTSASRKWSSPPVQPVSLNLMANGFNIEPEGDRKPTAH
jgi:hypothetical protein